jgi:regulator of sirC expression with transglutaminase-like and TPR domain
MGFRGNSSDYYDPRNSFLNEVLDRRVGAPITLSILTAEVGRRLGLPLVEISFPGHFMVLYEGRRRSFALDPFHSGARVSIEEIGSRLKSVLGPSAELRGEHLRAVGKHTIIHRLLNNLAAIYRRASDTARAIAVLERQCIISPGILRVENELADLRLRIADRN